MSLILMVLGFLLLLRPLPTLLLVAPRRDRAFLEILEIFVDHARAGEATPIALQEALNVTFLPTAELSDFISKKYPRDPIATQFASMWQNLHRRGSGIVEGASVLTAMGRARIAQDEELAAKTSGARSTFRLLVLLPVWFLVVGQLVGLPALSILISHPWGYALISFAVLLMWLANRWMQRILAAV